MEHVNIVTTQDYVDRAPGELGDFGGFAKPVDRDEWEKVQMAEIKHGRLAMLGVSGCLAQELVTGQGPLEQLFKGNVRERGIETGVRRGKFLRERRG